MNRVDNLSRHRGYLGSYLRASMKLSPDCLMLHHAAPDTSPTASLCAQGVKTKGGVEMMKHYYRCSYSNCKAKKTVEKPITAEGEPEAEVVPPPTSCYAPHTVAVIPASQIITYNGEHSHMRAKDSHGGRRCNVDDVAVLARADSAALSVPKPPVLDAEALGADVLSAARLGPEDPNGAGPPTDLATGEEAVKIPTPTD